MTKLFDNVSHLMYRIGNCETLGVTMIQSNTWNILPPIREHFMLIIACIVSQLVAGAYYMEVNHG